MSGLVLDWTVSNVGRVPKQWGGVLHLPGDKVTNPLGERVRVTRCNDALRFVPMLPDNISEWRLELRAKEYGTKPCLDCAKTRMGVCISRPMEPTFLVGLRELHAFMAIAILDPDLDDKQRRLLLSATPAIESLLDQQPPGFVWVGKVGTSARWRPRTAPRSLGPYIEWTTKTGRGDWPVRRLEKMFRPPVVTPGRAA